MPGPSRNLERTRGRILAESEPLRLASTVHVAGGRDRLGDRVRGKAVLALTDCRVLLVSNSLRAGGIRLLKDWPLTEVRISVTRQKLGNSMIHLMPGDGGDLLFEWLGGHRARSWAAHRFSPAPGRRLHP